MKERFQGLIDIFKGNNNKKKIIIIISAVVFFVVWYWFIMWFAGCCVWLGVSEELRANGRIWLGLHEYHKFALILYVISSAIILFSIFRNTKLNQTAYKDERGVYYMDKATHGSSHFATAEEIDEYFYEKNIEETDQFIIGRDEDNGKIVSFKFKDHGATGTKNIMVIASSGSGKSASVVLPNLLNLPKRENPESAVIVDPSGELYLKTGQYFRNNGYDVKLFNLKDLDYSEYWDCLQECISEQTGRIDTNRLQSFALIFMKNSATAKDQDVWFEVAQNLIEACIGLVGYKREIYIINQYIATYEQITGDIDSKFKEICTNKYVPFQWCEDQILYVARKQNIDEEGILEIFKNIKNAAPKFNISAVYDVINNIESKQIIESFSFIPKFYPARAAWARYEKKKDGLKDGAINGAQFKFKIFDDDRLRNLISNEGINFKTINLKKSAYFIAISDTDETLKPIASLFFSFFYKDAQENYDIEEQKAAHEGRKNRCLTTLAMLDEFASLGVITGSETQFGTIMSDSRKRDIYQCIIIQNYLQLEGTYGKFVRDQILSSCQTQLFMGANDPSTQEYISKKTGVATIMEDSHKEVSNPLGHNTTLLTNEMSVGSTSRNIITEDEAGKVVDEILVMRQWCSPFFVKPFFWKEHPAYINDECPEVSYYENVEYSGDPYLAPDFDYEQMLTAEEKETKIDHQKVVNEQITSFNTKETLTIDDLLNQMGIEIPEDLKDKPKPKEEEGTSETKRQVQNLKKNNRVISLSSIERKPNDSEFDQ